MENLNLPIFASSLLALFQDHRCFSSHRSSPQCPIARAVTTIGLAIFLRIECASALTCPEEGGYLCTRAYWYSVRAASPRRHDYHGRAKMYIPRNLAYRYFDSARFPALARHKTKFWNWYGASAKPIWPCGYVAGLQLQVQLFTRTLMVRT